MELKNEFDKELDEYISSRKSSGFSGIFNQNNKKDELEESVPITEVYNDELPQNNDPKIEEQNKPRGIRKLFSFFSSEENEENVDESKIDNVVLDDMKEIAKISLSIIKLLPPEKIITFKSSNEFSKLKDILSKHKLIK